MSETEGVVLVLAGGMQKFREYLLAGAARRVRLWLLEKAPPTWQTPHLVGHTVVDVFDPEQAIRAAHEVAARVPVIGVYCYHEAVITTASLIAERLVVPGPPPHAVKAVRDKLVTRRMLAEAGIRQPRFAVASTLEQAEDAARHVGYPLIAKPRNLGASEGVVKATGPGQLAAAFATSAAAEQEGMEHQASVLLEEYIEGPEISVDAAVFKGEYMPYLIAHKELGGEPYFEETGHTVLAADPLHGDSTLTEMLSAAHRAVGWDHGNTHTEVKLSPQGPVIVEINGRLGGDLIPYLGELANGVNSGTVSIDLVLGLPPEPLWTRQITTAIRFLRPPRTCTVRGIALPAPDPGSGLVASVPLAAPGERLLMPPDGYLGRYGYLIAQAETRERCRAVLDAAEQAAILEYES